MWNVFFSKLSYNLKILPLYSILLCRRAEKKGNMNFLPILKITKKSRKKRSHPIQLTVKYIHTDLVQIFKCDYHGISIISFIVMNVMLRKKLLDSARYLRVTELRHTGEQVVLDLVVQVRHPPVDEVERSRSHIHGMDCSVSYPIYSRVLLGHNWQVSMRNSKVDKNIV